MSYTIEEIKDDLINCDIKQFYMKHIVRSDNWYFENILNIPQDKIITAVDDFKIIVSEAMGISYNSIMMVGSGKTGCSLSPQKHLKQFTIEPTAENKSILILQLSLCQYLIDFGKNLEKLTILQIKDITHIFHEKYIVDT